VIKWKSAFNIIFSAVGFLLILFIVLPLFSTIFSTTPNEFIHSFSDPEVIKSIILTFSASIIATSIAAITGIPLAYLLARHHFYGKQLLEAIINIPVVIPHTAAGIALLLVFGRRGLLGTLFSQLGITFTDNIAGIVVAMLFVSLPYLVNMSRDSFTLVDDEYEKAALADGASPWQAFFSVTLPLAWRGVLGGAIMMWARGISEFGAVVILAYHPKIAPVLVYERFQGYGLDAAQPIALILILVAVIVFIAIRAGLLPEGK
jgi:molybdate/tungstate transport system permease protein